MAAETAKINRLPVSKSDLQWMPKFGVSFDTPEGCLGCAVLATGACAEAVGIEVVIGPNMAGGETEIYFPQAKQIDAQIEMERRVAAAVDGSCVFVEEQNCWRVIEDGR